MALKLLWLKMLMYHPFSGETFLPAGGTDNIINNYSRMSISLGVNLFILQNSNAGNFIVIYNMIF